VLRRVDHPMKCMTEEHFFGPTMPIMKVQTRRVAVRLATIAHGLRFVSVTRTPSAAEQIDAAIEPARRRQRRDDQLRGPSAPDGRRKGLRPGLGHGAGGIRKYAAQQASS